MVEMAGWQTALQAEGHCIIIAEGEEMVGTSSRAGMGGAQVRVKQEGTSPLDMRSARQESGDCSRPAPTPDQPNPRPRKTLGILAADVRYLARRGFPDFPPATQDDLAMEVFVRGLTPTVLCQQVRLAAPTFLELTVAHAERVKVYSRRGSMTGPFGGSRRRGPITHHPEPAWPNPVKRKPRTAPASLPSPQSWSPL
ncbi:hypothetical protein EOD39_1942 [Acipenser ruthenus]|uniref:Uncharacterized protein n=1 Tax=Acipenser ruthenus TaxID=7906 RepID=A0A444U5M8_ACIRT|nr:hypothetical protein EOD39_1942 [Acipenser ruthenus]